ncbi:MAG: DUF4140 domain-containing protein [Pseudolabrys sp.]|nr:DUF4140 domain-containing protein [Pseudolabrys sp.]
MRRLLSLSGIGIGAGIALAALSVAAQAADIESTSRIDNVIVYPDGATVTRIIKADLAAGDSTLLTRDLPLSLDPSSLRVEGEGGANLTIGAIDIRTPRPSPPANLPEIDKRIEAPRSTARLPPPMRGENLRNVSRKARRPVSATKAKRGRSVNGGRPSPLWPRKSPPPMAPCARRK